MSRSYDRRRFLGEALTASAAFATAAKARAAEPDEASGEASDSPAESIVLGVMGTGGRGTALAKEFAQLRGARVAYVCDADERRMADAAQAAASQQSLAPEQVRDFRRILDDGAVDALVIAAPDHWHAPAAILACAAKKHVYVEKPACHNPHEAELLVEAAGRFERVVQHGTQRRSSPSVIAAIERVQQGELGEVRFARGWINSQRPNIGRGKKTVPPEWLDWNLWQGPAPDREFQDNYVHYNWHWFWHWGTGELGNNGVHALDLCRWGLGVGLPDRVVCGGGKLFFDDDQQTPDTQIATFVFGRPETPDDRVEKAIHWEHRTWHRRGFEQETFGVQFYGDRGSLIITSNKYRQLDMQGAELASGSVDRGEFEHLEDFLAAVRTGSSPNAEIREGVDSTMLCLLGNIAYRTGSTVDVDPAARQIINNPAASELWQREYRPEWQPRV